MSLKWLIKSEPIQLTCKQNEKLVNYQTNPEQSARQKLIFKNFAQFYFIIGSPTRQIINHHQNLARFKADPPWEQRNKSSIFCTILALLRVNYFFNLL